ncbi:MAG: DNA cytosine methyltransferase [Helicobacteraceae bacterium]|jgi:DNA (cytosine-5)-methyltransferase 1|nr:DNA cytosine methyltransferase [Helicobacteraceae bacterium]
MTFLDLFSGIGGFRLGMESAGHICVGFCEKDKYAIQSYRAIHNTEGEWYANNIREVKAEEMPQADCWCFGFPCQPFSIAGKRKGLGDTEKGDLFYVILRLAGVKKPEVLFAENVKGFLSVDRGRIFWGFAAELDELGYDLQWQIIDSADYIPQHRERLYIVGCLRGSARPQVFPLGRGEGAGIELPGQTPVANTITASYGTSKGYGSYIGENQQPQTLNTITAAFGSSSEGGCRKPLVSIKNLNKGVSAEYRIYDSGGLAPTLNAGGGSIRNPIIIQRGRGKNKSGGHSIAPTLTSHDYEHNNLLNEGDRIRRLTPLECWRLQGFPDWAFDRARAAGVSDSQLYKQAGNSVTVPVIEAIAGRLRTTAGRVL